MASSLPLVSVIVRSMDRPTLKEALDSISTQTYPNIEVIVVNASGVPHSALPEHLGEAALRLVGGSAPLRRSAAANLGLREAAGAYLLFLDDDDWLCPEHISRLVAQLEGNPGLVLSYGGVECVVPASDGEGWQRTHVFAQPFDRTRLLVENYIPLHAALFRRTCVAGESGCRFDEALDVYEDWDFWVQLSHRGDFGFVNEIGAVYRIADASGFGVAGNPEVVTASLQKFFGKWRSLWSAAEVNAIAGYAKHHSMYWELRDILEQRFQELQEARDAAELTQRTLAEREAELARLKCLCDVFKDDVSRLNEELAQVYGSRSWRVTAPMRKGLALARVATHRARAWHYFVRQNVNLALQIGRAEGLGTVLRRGRQKLARLRARQQTDASKIRVSVESAVHALSLPVVAAGVVPEVSIVIPVHNKHLYTFTCLKSLSQALDEISCEVLVVDDHSTDETVAMLSQIAGVRVIQNRGERGFVHTCNLGAANATGRVLVFLNNDTWVEPGWLAALLDVLRTRPDAGLVGAKLLYPDGSLQEAGAILWRDGSAWNYGKGQDETRPEFNYLRAVDYCSGAAIAVPRHLFESVGGFGLDFAPAYYEDADLALKLQEAGYKAYYQPHARVYHFEGVSAGQNTLAGLKSYQLANRDRLFHKWAGRLYRHQINGVNVRMERDRGACLRVLVVDKVMLTPDQDSGSLRMFRLLQEMVGLGIKVVFATLYLDDSEPGRSLLQAEGIEVLTRPHVSTVQTYLTEFGAEFDAIVLSRLDVAEQLVDVARQTAPRAKVLFDTVDLHFLREERMAEHLQDRDMAVAAQKRRDIEIGLMRKSDVTLVVSSFEQELLQREVPDIKVAIISNIHELHPCEGGYREREGMLFIGGFNHPPNVDAVCHFVHEILPIVERSLGAVPVWIIGSHPPEEIRALASGNVHVTGFVEDVSGFFQQVRLSVAPLRYGAGVKGKVNQSMAFGVPVVATGIAVEGMELQDGVDVLVGDTPEAFAEAIVNLYQDAGLWQRLSAAGRDNIDRHFSRGLARETVRELLLAGN